MTNTSDLFANSADPASVEPQASQSTQDQSGTLFIGEGKQYASVEDADKAIAFKENHISTLERENAELRAKTEAARTIDDVLESIKNQQLVPEPAQPTAESSRQDTQDIDAIVAAKLSEGLTAYEVEKKEAANAQEVFNKLKTLYGDKAGEMYTSKAKDLGIDLDGLSKVSPKAVLEYFKEPSPSHSSGYQSSVNTANMSSGTVEFGTYEYWNQQEKAKAVTRDQKYKLQHEWLEKLGPAAFYGTT
jgi:hypothetical protein